MPSPCLSALETGGLPAGRFSKYVYGYIEIEGVIFLQLAYDLRGLPLSWLHAVICGCGEVALNSRANAQEWPGRRHRAGIPARARAGAGKAGGGQLGAGEFLSRCGAFIGVSAGDE